MQIPYTKNEYNTHYNALNLVFRIILPEVLTFLAVLFVRFWPAAYVSHLQGTQVGAGEGEATGEGQTRSWGVRLLCLIKRVVGPTDGESEAESTETSLFMGFHLGGQPHPEGLHLTLPSLPPCIPPGL